MSGVLAYAIGIHIMLCVNSFMLMRHLHAHDRSSHASEG